MINNLSQSVGRFSGRNHSRLFQVLLTITGGGVSLLLLFLLLMGAQSEAQAAFSNQVAGVDVGLDQNGSGLPSEIVTYYHTLTNTGDSPDTYSITLESPVPAGWNVTIEPTTTTSIPAGATMPFTVMVQIASNAISGTEYAAVIQATSMTDTAVIDSLTDTTTVNLAFDLDLIPPINTGTTTAGTNVTYTHFIVNNSNAAETIQIETSSTPNWTITPSMQMVSVGPFETEPFSFTIGIPSNGGGTVHTALVTATSSLSPSVQLTATDITTVTEIPGASGV
ncbi:MAG: hypothetical protein GWO10_03540, partial [candidate division Zixibacteria bacterium]|nr:hypothetical protein [Gammaproteobacteria bacterium]NIR25459.1 hypothetical protein [Gammaproteobacteria bacterium]NIR62866.1 hypothetical protein [candidate division Zixibacteria bacterium]NIW43767.1 hypothetical protein [Gammaproteobacteria bacterium]